MPSSESTVLLSRILTVILCFAVWVLAYFDAWYAYRLPRSYRRLAIQLSLVLGASVTFVMQINLMNHLSPADAQGDRFFAFVLIECGGALIILFSTLLKERVKNKNQT